MGKKILWTTLVSMEWGGGTRTLVDRPLEKKHLLFCLSSLREAAKKSSSTNGQVIEVIKALPLPSPSVLMAIGTFFIIFFSLKIAENGF